MHDCLLQDQPSPSSDSVSEPGTLWELWVLPCLGVSVGFERNFDWCVMSLEYDRIPLSFKTDLSVCPFVRTTMKCSYWNCSCCCRNNQGKGSRYEEWKKGEDKRPWMGLEEIFGYVVGDEKGLRIFWSYDLVSPLVLLSRILWKNGLPNKKLWFLLC